METICYNFHDDDGTIFGKFALEAGDDAGAVKWMEVSKDLKLYASHVDFIKRVVEMRNAFW